jgi:ribosomal protein S18 acetylase RimI-like enzyme
MQVLIDNNFILMYNKHRWCFEQKTAFFENNYLHFKEVFYKMERIIKTADKKYYEASEIFVEKVFTASEDAESEKLVRSLLHEIRAKKYYVPELDLIMVDENDEVLGYAFCQFIQHIDNNILTDIKTLYIDDLCVDEEKRGMHIGKQLYEYVLDFAKKQGCYNVTLNVWSCNENAMKFYEKCGLVPQKVGMEVIL